MALKNEILTLLEQNRGIDLSGQMLAERFGVSRNAVWKAITALKADGYSIESGKNRGYRLSSGCDRLSAEAIQVNLRHGVDVTLLDEVDSTNNEAKRMLSDGYEGTGLVVARRQTAGRGRLGRSFYSPAGTGIYMTLIRRPREGMRQVTRVTAAAALAVCRAIESLTDLRPGIKWVNDVYLDGKKICGILSEAVTDVESGSVQSVIVGIGVNITTADFPEEIAGRVTSLGVELSPSVLIAAICDSLLDLWEDLSDPAIMEGYRARSVVIGKEIDFYAGDVKRSGVAVDIDENGGLIVNCDRERVVLQTGEITVRLKGDPR